MQPLGQLRFLLVQDPSGHCQMFPRLFEAEVQGRTEQVGAGQALVLGAGAVRRLRAVGGPAQALVAMAVGGQATVPGGDEKIPLPWAR